MWEVIAGQWLTLFLMFRLAPAYNRMMAQGIRRQYAAIWRGVLPSCSRKRAMLERQVDAMDHM